MAFVVSPTTSGACFQRRVSSMKPIYTVRCAAQAKDKPASAATGIVFQPFEEVQPVLANTAKKESLKDSFARSDYHERAEAGVNEQINVEYTISYVYESMQAFFSRDSVGLPGFAKFFQEASDEERDHAHKLMDYQTTRGGRVKLQAIVMPEVELNNEEKGDALFAMELALSLEKLNFQKLRQLRSVADEVDDAALGHYIDSELLKEQTESVKQHAEYVSQLRRIGGGHGVWHFDRELQEAA